MRLVVDASVAIKWVVDEADSEQAISLHRFELLSPELLFSECANALWKAAQRGRRPPIVGLQKTDALDRVPMTIVPARSLAKRALEIAIDLSHPAYDTLYLALAESYAARVVASDARLLGRLSGSSFAQLAISLHEAAAN